MQDILSVIKQEKLVILSRGLDTETLLLAAETCMEAGITLFECTFDHLADDPVHDNAEKITALVKAAKGRMRVGAGTVLTAEEVRASADSGAEFIISPCTDEEVMAETKKLGLLSIPGAMTPTEIVHARKLGADMVKLFPADDIGVGPHYIQNLKGPLPHIPLMATGGVNPGTIPMFLNAGIDAVGTGVTVLRKDLISKGDYDAIRTLAKMHIDAVKLCTGRK